MDPSQSEGERKKLREKYNQLEQRIKESGDDIPLEKLNGFMQELNDLHEQAKYISEAEKDYRLIKDIATLYASITARNISVRGITISSLVDAFKKKFPADEEGETDWGAIGLAARPYLRTVRHVGFMQGVLDLEVKQKERKKREKKIEAQGPLVKPEDISEKKFDKDEETQNDKRVDAMYQTLPDEPFPYYKFVVDPESFSASVERIFDLSFLIKQGKAEIEFDKEGIPYLRKVEQKPTVIMAIGQTVVSFSYEDWERAKSSFNITTPYTPPAAQ